MLICQELGPRLERCFCICAAAWVLTPVWKCRTAGDAAVRGERDGCGGSPGVRPRAGSEAEPQGLPARACHLQRGLSFYANCFHCFMSHTNPAHHYVQNLQIRLSCHATCFTTAGGTSHLDAKLVGICNGQHREKCLLLGTITCVDNMTVCMLSMLADITPCSPIKKPV